MANGFNNRKLEALILKCLGKQPTKLSPLKSGEISAAYSFEIGNKKYIIRLASKDCGFKIDRFIADKYSSLGILIPATLNIGKIDYSYYSITQKCPGVLINDLDDNHLYKLIPEFVAATYSFHLADTSSTTGFGDLDAEGNGSFVSWPKYLLSLDQISSPYWSKDYFSLHQNIIHQFLPTLPSCRSLIHGDLGLNNVLTSRNYISGIIDWSDAKYGDFVYDIAYLYFWSNNIDYLKIFYQYYSSQKTLDLSHYKDRINCYTIHIGLNLLNYFAKTKQLDSFNYVKNRLDTLTAIFSI